MWSGLECFYLVGRLGSISRAARELKIHQSSLSRRIQKLENQLGYSLLHRCKGGVEFTQKGEYVYKAAESMTFSLIEAQSLATEPKGMEGKLRLCSYHAICNYVLLPLTFEFNKLYPDIVFEIICNDDLDIDVITDEIDIMIGKYNIKQEDKLFQEKLMTMEAGLYATSTYLEQYGTPQRVEDLVNHKFISYSQPHRYKYEEGDKVVHHVDWFMELTPGMTQKNIALKINSISGLYTVAQEGKGIISSYKQFNPQDKGLIRILKNVKGKPMKNHYISPLFKKNNQKIQTFKKFLSETLRSTEMEVLKSTLKCEV